MRSIFQPGISLNIVLFCSKYSDLSSPGNPRNCPFMYQMYSVKREMLAAIIFSGFENITICNLEILFWRKWLGIHIFSFGDY